MAGIVRQEDKDDYVLSREYDVGHYRRHFWLPDSVDRNKIEAVLSNGVMTLTLAKVEAVSPRRIPIAVAG